MIYNVAYAPSAEKALSKLPHDAQRRVIQSADNLAENPRPPGCVKLSGQENVYRVRVGTFRVVYQIEDRKLLVLVVRIAQRREVCR